MVLDKIEFGDDVTRAQTSMLIAIVVMSALLTGASIQLTERTTDQISPAHAKDAQNPALTIANDFDRSAEYIIMSNNYEGSGYTTGSAEDDIDQLATVYNNGVINSGTRIEVTNVDATSGEVIDGSLSAGNTNQEIRSDGESLNGGYTFTQSAFKEASINGETNGVEIVVVDTSTTHEITLYNNTGTTGVINVTTSDPATPEITAPLEQTNTLHVDESIISINGYTIKPDRNAAVQSIELQNAKLDGRVSLVTDQFQRTAGFTNSTAVSKINYDLSVVGTNAAIQKQSELTIGEKTI